MGYDELKELIIRNQKKNSNYLDEQIEILDDKLALLQACGLELPEKEKKELIVLEMLIKIKEEINSNTPPSTPEQVEAQLNKGYDTISKKVVKE